MSALPILQLRLSPASAPTCIPGHDGIPDSPIGALLCGTTPPTVPAPCGRPSARTGRSRSPYSPSWSRSGWPGAAVATATSGASTPPRPAGWRSSHRSPRPRQATIGLWRLLATLLPAPRRWSLRPHRAGLGGPRRPPGHALRTVAAPGGQPDRRTAAAAPRLARCPGRADRVPGPRTPGRPVTLRRSARPARSGFPLIDDPPHRWAAAQRPPAGGRSAAARCSTGSPPPDAPAAVCSRSTCPAHPDAGWPACGAPPSTPAGPPRPGVQPGGRPARRRPARADHHRTGPPHPRSHPGTCLQPAGSRTPPTWPGRRAGSSPTPRTCSSRYMPPPTGPTRAAARAAADDITCGFGLLSAHLTRRRVRRPQTVAPGGGCPSPA